MAVPKKRTSKAKKNQRKANWKKIALKQTEKSRSLFQLKSAKIKSDCIVVDEAKDAKGFVYREKRKIKKMALRQKKETKNSKLNEKLAELKKPKEQTYTKILNNWRIELPRTFDQ